MLLAPGPKLPTWMMCVDYITLNLVCPNDPFHLSHIDLLVDETTGCVLLSFMDDFYCYRQIFMEKDDDKKIFFKKLDGFFYYLIMVLKLKNLGVAYT